VKWVDLDVRLRVLYIPDHHEYSQGERTEPGWEPSSTEDPNSPLIWNPEKVVLFSFITYFPTQWVPIPEFTFSERRFAHAPQNPAPKGNVNANLTWKRCDKGSPILTINGNPIKSTANEASIKLDGPENDDEASQMLIFLGREMQFFDRLVTSLRLEDQQQNESNDIGEALGTAKTIKESVEKWLGKRLSKPWTNLLTILNELLSILKGG
jgi:hypothetical protein